MTNYLANVEAMAREVYADTHGSRGYGPLWAVGTEMPTPKGELGCQSWREAEVGPTGVAAIWSATFYLDGVQTSRQELLALGLGVTAPTNDPFKAWVEQCVTIASEPPSQGWDSTRTAREHFMLWATSKDIDIAKLPPANTFSQRIAALEGVRLTRRSSGTLAIGLVLAETDGTKAAMQW